MIENIFKGVFDTSSMDNNITVGQFSLCIGIALLLGLVIALVHRFKNRYTKSFINTVALLPAIVCVVIMMVNGNVGTGIAVAGAFSIIRFRSVPGNAKEIGTIFLAMCAGITCGIGYLGYAIIFVGMLCGAMIIYSIIGFGAKNDDEKIKILKITIPEDLDYVTVFDEIMATYTKKCELFSSKTTNLGSMYKLQYHIILNDAKKEKEFMDAIRCKNGNLEVSIAMPEVNGVEL